MICKTEVSGWTEETEDIALYIHGQCLKLLGHQGAPNIIFYYWTRTIQMHHMFWQIVSFLEEAQVQLGLQLISEEYSFMCRILLEYPALKLEGN